MVNIQWILFLCQWMDPKALLYMNLILVGMKTGLGKCIPAPPQFTPMTSLPRICDTKACSVEV